MVQRMKYQLVASSRSRATEIYRGEDGSLVQVEHYRSGVTDAWPVESIPESLTVRYSDGEVWETDPIMESVTFPAQA